MFSSSLLGKLVRPLLPPANLATHPPPKTVAGVPGMGFGATTSVGKKAELELQKALTKFKCPEGKDYASCCGRYHPRSGLEASALDIIKARYCALVLGNAEYIAETTHKNWKDAKGNTRNKKKSKVIAQKICDAFEFKDIKILSADEQGDKAQVKYTFSYGPKEGGARQIVTEMSTLVRENGKWKYLAGEELSGKNLNYDG
eukprot:jgi/Mesvir1/7916/Mv11841-RA.1